MVRTVPQPGDIWFIDLGLVVKPRYALVLAAQPLQKVDNPKTLKHHRHMSEMLKRKFQSNRC